MVGTSSSTFFLLYDACQSRFDSTRRSVASFLPEEAVKRAVMAEVQRAVRVAVAESRATERLRMHRLLDVPLSQRSHPAIRQGPYLRVHGNSGPVEGSVRAVAAPSAASNSIPSTSEDEKDPHVQNVSGSVSIPLPPPPRN